MKGDADAAEAQELITDMLEELREAKQEYADAAQREGEASRHETSCLNRLNNAQKQIDEWLTKQKHDAAHDSDWANQIMKHHNA